MFFVPFDLLFESFALLLVFGGLLLDVEGLFLDVLESGLDGVAAAFLVTDEVFHLVVFFHELSVVSGLDVFESGLGFGYSLSQVKELFLGFLEGAFQG